MPFKTPPRALLTPFAAEGTKNAIPDAAGGMGDGYAAYNSGFPPETQLPIASGGIPPRRGDFNGILNDLSGLQYYLSYGPVYWPFSNVVAANGGYPLGALIRPDLNTDGRVLTAAAENTMSNPNSDPSRIGVDWFRANGVPDYNPGVNHYVGELVIWTGDLNCHRCIRANGPQYGGVFAPDNKTYWETLAEYIARMGVGGSGLPDGGEPGDFLQKDAQNNPAWIAGKTTPSAAQTFYVRTDGNNANDGTADTAAGAFRTISGGILSILRRQYTSPYKITMYVGAGVYNETVSVDAGSLSSSEFEIRGAGTEANKWSETTIAGTSSYAVGCNGGTLRLRYLSGSLAVDGDGCFAANAGKMIIDDCGVTLAAPFQETEGGALLARSGGQMALTGTIYISTSNANAVFRATGSANIGLGQIEKSCLLRLSGAATYCVHCNVSSSVGANPNVCTFDTSAGVNITQRFLVDLHGSILPHGGGADFFPGTAAGFADAASFGYYGN